MNRPDLNDLPALIASKLDGTISDTDHARLERLLTESTEARSQWFLHSDIETGMADWAAVRRELDLQKAVPFPIPAAGAVRPLWRWLLPLASAAAIMLTAIWWIRDHSTQPSTADAAIEEPKANGVAVLARAVGVEWADGNERASGTVLEAGLLRLRSGAALVEFFSGARVVMEGPTEFQLVSSGEAFLRSGKINAHVPPQAVGFTVNSPTMKVVDHGTDFGVTVGSGAAPEVHVFTGKVEVASASLAPRALNGGEAARFDGTAVQSIPAARASFVTEDELSRRDSALAVQRLAAWREAARGLSADAATLIHYTFDESTERSIPNQSAGAPPDSHGSIVGSAWTEGRWPGKNALQFRSESDRIRFTAAQPIHAITLLAWVRVDALPRWQNVLLSTDSEQPGALRWHLTKTGELRFEIARNLGRPHSDWEAVNSAPFVTADRLGQWLHLATTFDGTTIRHYANGQPIGSGASFTPPALQIGTAELANWRGDTKRQLAAALDEFAILSRAITAEEVRAIYDSGRP